MGVVRMHEIINTITPPQASVYRVYEDGSSSSKVLYLNGKPELSVTPSLEEKVVRVFITGNGKRFLLKSLI